MHGYCLYFSEFAELFQIAAEFIVSFICVAFAGIRGFVVIANFVTQ
jgi:hypothetical protein